ncbi:YwdI family protein [Neobacillus endophyticus]|uniref:YwdI family protein n=1 Tax=Neobacillus endophyticus TaxID=2738405 RepID=UPI0028AE1DED|nr:YwdI family protein [Neobacillus endophyticus]
MQKLLSKMEAELKQAQKGENLREKIYSIKILCELILDEQQVKGGGAWTPETITPQVPPQPAYIQQVFQPQVVQQPAAMPQPKKMELDDGANGDSLLDF